MEIVISNKIYHGGVKCRNKYRKSDNLDIFMQMINIPNCTLSKISYESSCGFIFKLDAPDNTDPNNLPFLNLNKEATNYNVPVYSIILKLTLLCQDIKRKEARVYIGEHYIDKENRRYAHRFNKESEFINETIATNKIYKRSMLSGLPLCPSILSSLLFNNDPAKLILNKLKIISSKDGIDNEPYRMLEFILNQINSDDDVFLGILSMESIAEYETLELLSKKDSIDNINSQITEFHQKLDYETQDVVLKKDVDFDEDVDEKELDSEVTRVMEKMHDKEKSETKIIKSKTEPQLEKETIYCNVLFNILRLFYESGIINKDLHACNVMGLFDINHDELHIKLIDFDYIDDNGLIDINFNDYYEKILKYKKLTLDDIQRDLIVIFNVTPLIYNEFVSRKMRNKSVPGYNVNGEYLYLINVQYLNLIANYFHTFVADYIKKPKKFKINMLSAFNCYNEIKPQRIDFIQKEEIVQAQAASQSRKKQKKRKKSRSRRHKHYRKKH